jgi:gliding motility-associated-like protein
MLLHRYIGILIVFLLCGLPHWANASHIAGGEISYICREGNKYTIRLDIYQDCIGGDPSAIREDTPAYIGVFNLDNGQGQLFTNVSPQSVIDVPANFSNSCVNNPPVTCLKRLTFVINTELASNSNGYRIAYVRCCRNGSTVNIKDANTTGTTYYIDIPPLNLAYCNTSAVFKNYPPQIICVNNPLIYDHAATDADGDSLTYEFCTAYKGGSLDAPKPAPTGAQPAALIYKAPYSFSRPMTGSPGIKISPTTGLITGTPNEQGRYVVTVCCSEWRNGVKINVVRREFQFVVTNCSKAVVADIPQLSNDFNTYLVECESNTVRFINKSTGANLDSPTPYTWDLGVPGAVSNEFEPTYTYPDTGTYTVKLIVNKGSTCPDSISRFVKIYPSFRAEYEQDGLLCPGSLIQFKDLSTATYGEVNTWNWSFGDSTFSTEKDPFHIYNKGGNYSVTLISTSSKGCEDTLVKQVDIENFKPFAGNDTIIVKGERVNFNATGGVEYTWTPADGLVFPNSSNPVGSYPDTGVYRYMVHIKSAAGCEGSDDIEVLVVDNPSLYMPTGFTPNGDGLNDMFRPRSVGYSEITFFRVFSRWGEMVYESNQIGDGWDGTHKGQLCEIGAYYWVLGVKNRFGQTEMIKGDVTLIR